MSRTQIAPKWRTLDGRSIPLYQLSDQHLANIYWYHKTMDVRIHSKINLEILSRFKGFVPPLEYMPLPVDGEIDRLRKAGMIVGTDIMFEGIKIGTISHIKDETFLG